MRILIVEDDAAVRMAYYRFLKREGHEALTHPCSSGVDSFILTFKPHLVLTDNDLGRGQEKGLSLAGRLIEAGYPAILMSGDPKLADEAKEKGIPFHFKLDPLGDLFELINSMEVNNAGAEEHRLSII